MPNNVTPMLPPSRPRGPAEPNKAMSPAVGAGMAMAAYVFWGFLPLYFAATRHLPPTELLAHRVIWAIPFAVGVMAFQGRLRELPTLFADRKIVVMMAITAVLIACNWGVYIYAVSINLASQAALGYYFTPLIAVVMGAMLLDEKLSRLQIVAVCIAAFAVVLRTVLGGEFPLIGLTLAFSFALYAYFRKTVAVGPTQGFLLEVIILSPIALAYIFWLAVHGSGHFLTSTANTLWLLGCGPVTAIPLILYSFGAKALRLASIGIMGYVGPTIIFIVAFTMLGEKLDWIQLSTFAMVWFALVIYSLSIFRTKPA